MEIGTVKIASVKRFRAPLEVSFKPGMNIVAGPNEAGKSTLWAALRAGLFEKSRSKAESVRALAGREGGTPTVSIQARIGGRGVLIEKRFLGKEPRTSLSLDDGSKLIDLDAEEAILSMLGAEAPGARGADAQSMRAWAMVWAPQEDWGGWGDWAGLRDMEGWLRQAAGSLQGEVESAAIQEAVRSKIAALEDGHGKPKGRLAEATAAAKSAAAKAQELGRRLAEARGRMDRLGLIGESLDKARIEALEAKAAAEAERPDLIRSAASERRARESALALARAELAKAEGVEAAGRSLELELTEAERAAGEDSREASAMREAAIEAKAKAEAAAASWEAAGGAALADEAAAIRTLSAAAEAMGDVGLVEATVEREPGSTDGGVSIRIDGSGMGAEMDYGRVEAESVEVEVAGWGTVRVSTQAAGRRDAMLAQASERMASIGFRTIADMEEAVAESERLAASSEAAREAYRRAEAAYAASESKAAQSKARAERLGSAAEAKRAEAQTASKDVPRLSAEVQAASLALAMCPEVGPRDAEESEKRLGKAKIRLEGLESSIRMLETERAAILGALREAGASGIGEAAAEAEGLAAEAARRLDRVSFELAALKRLWGALAEAKSEEDDLFGEAIAERMGPWAAEVLGADGVEPGRLGMAGSIGRGGVFEEASSLSAGAREQLRILARVAAATLAADFGKPCVLVLDDPFASSDDARSARLMDVVRRTSSKVQAIVFTCRPVEALEGDNLIRLG